MFRKAGPPLPDAERYSQEQLSELFAKAKTHTERVPRKMKPCPTFCRDKTSEYYRSLPNDVMAKYVKDNHGDPMNPINGRLHGLFFAVNNARKHRGRPSTQSDYGETRLSIPASQMVRWTPNLYFSDFYCVNRMRPAHYVQIVMTTPGSEADLDCRRKLFPLDIRNNPFFCVEGDVGCECPDVADCDSRVHVDGEYPKDIVCPLKNCRYHPITCRVTTGVWLEMFFTNSIELTKSKEELSQVQMIGKRSGGTIGLRKNIECQICNVHPQTELRKRKRRKAGRKPHEDAPPPFDLDRLLDNLQQQWSITIDTLLKRGISI